MGPLTGFKVIEMAGIGPAPFCAMLLSDMGAEVVRIDRKSAADLGVDMPARYNVSGRGRRSVALDLKSPDAVAAVRKLAAQADALIEGFRPGVMERLGLGPEELLTVNPKLVYGRVTGWGQTGPLAKAAGHDLNYIALTGMLHAIGPAERPVPPLNLVGDFGGGAMYLAFGVVCALLEASRSGKGQVVDAAMVDGAASLGAPVYGMYGAGLWKDQRADNLLDSGAPWYDVYQTKDGKFVSVGAIEQRFYDLLLKTLGLEDDKYRDRGHDNWPVLREAFNSAFRSRTRDEWCAIMEGTDICFAPVMSLAEAPSHEHMAARGVFVEQDGVVQPAPAPRFSRTREAIQSPPPEPGQHTEEVLRDWGFTEQEIEALRG
ncbi:CaiB/BaiF CoA transferase family protein [Rhodoligotrophos ferricapiens]|uniref:CaiB/BaiF CoA transferase family protein n=1 Tax=Rhodoligotrophos ferricapiens TaxID=3069264 RepID=UPI00315DFC10